SGSGTVSLSASASGTDANSGTAVAPGAVAASAVTVQQPAALTLSASLNPSTLSAGLQQLSLVLRATNPGEAGAVFAALPAPTIVTTGSASASMVTSPPSPAGTVLAGGATRSFVWTYSVAGSGSLSFVASASGSDENSATPLTPPAAQAGSATVQRPASLTIPSVIATPSLVRPSGATGREANAGTSLTASSVTSAPIAVTAIQVAITFPDNRATLQGGASLKAVASAWNTAGAPITQLSLSATGPATVVAPASISGSRQTVGGTFSVSANANAAAGSVITLVASATDAAGAIVSSTPVSVTVGPPGVLSLRCRPQPQLTIARGQSGEARLEAQLSDGSFQDATMSASWSSSATAIATVSAGVVRGVAAGAAKVTDGLGGPSTLAPG